MQSLTVTEAGKGRDFILTITTPNRNAHTVKTYLEGYLLDVLIDTLLDLKESCERREHHAEQDTTDRNV